MTHRIVPCIAFIIALLAVQNAAEAAIVGLQGGAADFSQGSSFSPSRAIDGEAVGTKGTSGVSWNGWAHNPDNTSPHTAVWETVTDITGTGELTISLFQYFTSDQNHRKIRLSVTTDDRSLFDDGLANGGDVTANWVVLNPTSATTSDGEVGTINLDGSIVWPDTAGATTLTDGSVTATGETYVITADTNLSGITGIRLEALTHAYGAENPVIGRTAGNAVLSEITVDFVENLESIPEPNTYILILLGSFGLILAFRRKISRVD